MWLSTYGEVMKERGTAGREENERRSGELQLILELYDLHSSSKT